MSAERMNPRPAVIDRRYSAVLANVSFEQDKTVRWDPEAMKLGSQKT